MTAADTTRWLLTINLKLGRGSGSMICLCHPASCTNSWPISEEYRAALKVMCSGEGIEAEEVKPGEIGVEALEQIPLPPLPSAGILSREAFEDIYEAEVTLGKVWGVLFDLHACGHPLHLEGGLFKGKPASQTMPYEM